VPGTSLPSVLHAGRGAPGAIDDGLRRAVALVVDQACRLPGVRGAAILIAGEEGSDALEVVAAAGEHRAHHGRFVRADAYVERLEVSAQAPVGDNKRRFATLAVTAADDPDLQPALSDLAALVALSWQDAGRTAVVAKVIDAGVGALAQLLALRDGYTGGHAEEVVELCDALAVRMGLTAEQVDELEMAARLHDLGKIGVPDVILHKPGRLTAAEWDVMRKHPVWGAEALASVPGAAGVAAAVRGHHERWDGSGYPDGLAGEDIPIASRIIAAADAWHAMTSNRSYRRALDEEHARQELRDGAGAQFDPVVVAALLVVVEDREDRFSRVAPRATTAADAAPPPPGGPDRRSRARALATAITRVSRLPALRESRERLDALLAAPGTTDADLLDVIEADLALTVATIRAGNALADRATITTVPEALRVVGHERLAGVVADVQSIDYFQQIVGWKEPLEHLRLHALATQRATSLVARMLNRSDHDTLLVGALLHDVGKLVLEQMTPSYPEGVHGDADTPDARARAERRALGFDHALVGGLMLRRWVLPEPLAVMVEGHHAEDAEDAAAVLRLADMLAHYAHARPVDPALMLHAAQAAGLTSQQLRALMFDLSKSGEAPTRPAEPSPLTRAQEQVLRGLAEGKVYKEIARDLGLSTSTVRSHCHGAYRRLGVADRSQAVLQATSRGWI
jgi:putative nucleotidyltransferase with HDIG domain